MTQSKCIQTFEFPKTAKLSAFAFRQFLRTNHWESQIERFTEKIQNLEQKIKTKNKPKSVFSLSKFSYLRASNLVVLLARSLNLNVCLRFVLGWCSTGLPNQSTGQTSGLLNSRIHCCRCPEYGQEREFEYFQFNFERPVSCDSQSVSQGLSWRSSLTVVNSVHWTPLEEPYDSESQGNVHSVHYTQSESVFYLWLDFFWNPYFHSMNVLRFGRVPADFSRDYPLGASYYFSSFLICKLFTKKSL